MNKKGLKRCPSCNSSNIYKRLRFIRTEKEKYRKHSDSEKIKRCYICRNCKYEFDNPVIEYKKEILE